ncbi:MAG: hypothetical protein NDJ75_01135 [Thermoanaerobaculia bacterium]|nr:hypothetical protein [Thermoanaerobaculia bacterium]
MRTAARCTVTLLCALAAGATAAGAVHGACVVGRAAPPGGLSRIALEPIGFPVALAGVAERAAAMWNAARCNNGTFPRFTLGGDADRALRVRWAGGLSPSTRGVCGEFAGDEIRLYAAAREPASRRLVPCGDADRVAETLAHELGHALGLLDVGGTACVGHIMSQIVRLPSGEIAPRAVQAAECGMADRRFVTLAERLAPPPAWHGGDDVAARLSAFEAVLPAPLRRELPRSP